MTGRFDRLSLKSFTPEDKAVGVAVGAVLAGAVGLAVFSPLSGDRATAGTLVQAAAVAQHTTAAHRSAHAGQAAKKATAGAQYRKEGFKVAPHRVKPSEVVKVAESQVGTHEGRGGQTKYTRWYVSTPQAAKTAKRDGARVADYNGASWCNMFVSWVGAQAGAKDMGWDAYTVQHATWLKKHHRWGEKARPGAVVFFDWQSGSGGGIGDIDHVGFVVKDNGNGTISTVEGNTDNAVKRKVRPKSTVVGYGYPDYR